MFVSAKFLDEGALEDKQGNIVFSITREISVAVIIISTLASLLLILGEISLSIKAAYNFEQILTENRVTWSSQFLKTKQKRLVKASYLASVA